jgi:hypothetical protein
MHGAILPLPNTPSWHGAQFKKKAQGQIYLYHTNGNTKYIVEYSRITSKNCFVD